MCIIRFKSIVNYCKLEKALVNGIVLLIRKMLKKRSDDTFLYGTGR